MVWERMLFSESDEKGTVMAERYYIDDFTIQLALIMSYILERCIYSS